MDALKYTQITHFYMLGTPRKKIVHKANLILIHPLCRLLCVTQLLLLGKIFLHQLEQSEYSHGTSIKMDAAEQHES